MVWLFSLGIRSYGRGSYGRGQLRYGLNRRRSMPQLVKWQEKATNIGQSISKMLCYPKMGQ
jgi:hypothetical protein